MNDQDYAIIVGINGYSALTPLKGASADAVRFKNWLTSPDGGGLPDSDSNVRIILSPEVPVSDPADGKPIKRDIDRAFRDFGLAIDPDVPIGRRLYFYFSGHGVGPDVDDVAMLMADATPSQLNNNVGMGPYRTMLRRTGRFKEIVFILDCCRDAVRGVQSTEPAFTFADLPIPRHPVEDFIVLASNWGEKAFERPLTEAEERGRLGVLTDKILKGLSDPAAANADGQITSETLRLYVIKQMAELAQQTGVDQSPDFMRPSKQEIVFRTLPPDQILKVRVRILALTRHTGDVVLRDGSFTELSRRSASLLTRDDQPWLEHLDRKSLYLVQYIPTGQLTGPIMPLDLRNAPSSHDFEFTNFN